jgi:hypothetical protein
MDNETEGKGTSILDTITEGVSSITEAMTGRTQKPRRRRRRSSTTKTAGRTATRRNRKRAGSCSPSHGRNVEAVAPEAGRGVNEITEAVFNRLVKVLRELTAFSDGFVAMGLYLWREAHIWKIGHDQV